MVSDLCSLSSCSRFWRELCGSDCIWEPLFRERWSLLTSFDVHSTLFPGNFQVWRSLYIMQHNRISDRARTLITCVKHSSASRCLEAGVYLQAVEAMNSMHLGFQDVELFFFRQNPDALLNAIGLIYCICQLKVPGKQIYDALIRCKISEQQVWVRWWKLGRWSRVGRMRDEATSRQVSFMDLATGKEETVLRVLQRGVVHEILRVCISTVDPASTPCSSSSVRNY
ncbi:PREDICTED: uncharacterized protein LOC104820238 isoform X2 [Tarenaya hassleriana]|uniref:uncharacterized protein LOC104820238 isoform X2 n=1 Tax=Tarenaya hassleriana TaxID=28532 RepID=UPI00053C65A5|nr:PREDICTED: uncharacterized protein LOC104820238 isoform X2 [Tarenaya hassleriana]